MKHYADEDEDVKTLKEKVKAQKEQHHMEEHGVVKVQKEEYQKRSTGRTNMGW